MRQLILSLFWLVALLPAACSYASAAPGSASDSRTPTRTPESVGLSSKELSRLKAHFQAYVDDNRLPGLTTLVSRKGEVVHFASYGNRDVGAADPMEKEDIFRIYSMTKPIIGVALMALHEDGKFKLDDEVSKYLPELKNLRVYLGENDDGTAKTEPTNRQITIRDLMRHTAGMTYGFNAQNSPVDKLYADTDILDRDQSTAEFITKLSKLPLKAQPGSRWIYSVSVDVQGRLIEVLSGKSLDVFLTERIFDPLGMKDTDFHVPEGKWDRLVRIYSVEDGTVGDVVDRVDMTFREKPAFFSGGGGLVSTTMDYWRFCQMVLNGGEFNGARVLASETIALMSKDHLPRDIRAAGIGLLGAGFGLDFAVARGPGKDKPESTHMTAGSLFWGGAANTRFWIDPKKDLVAIIMTNVFPPSTYPLHEEMLRMVYQSVIE